ncbi:hypothetical protein [Neomegalonema sp.]|uniref:hypothetical protein n=1 Tax=Neomegalonema sp. TaxID=2039713 RepID=UPI00260A1FE3|nr:hypothetical protein [Neomegalonema sp.]MDD2869635.1 hypothetical protein [Neomegalonema sp.]
MTDWKTYKRKGTIDWSATEMRHGGVHPETYFQEMYMNVIPQGYFEKDYKCSLSGEHPKQVNREA